MRVKICGITSERDADAAAHAGADAIGLNFVAGPRKIEPARARDILRHLPPLVTPVALVTLADGRISGPVRQLLEETRVAHLQLYGTITGEYLEKLSKDGFCPIPVLRVTDDRFAEQRPPWLATDPEPPAPAVVLDAFDPDRQGGTGHAFCWDWVAAARHEGRLDAWPPIILAGGLRPDNVARAVRIVRPYAVDVASGVEIEGRPGTKDPAKMRDFVRQACLGA